MNITKPKLIQFPIHGDERGNLVVAEEFDVIPFDIKRIFYIYNTSGDVTRGNHANRRSEFVMIAMHGSCKVKVFDREGEETFVLSSADIGLFLPKMTWKEMYDFSEDCVLMVIANTLYDRNEYIHTFDEFKMELKMISDKEV